MGLTLREVRDADLPLLFEQGADPVAVLERRGRSTPH
jgi:hypothetical protein